MTAKARPLPSARRTPAFTAALLLCLAHGACAADTIRLGGTGAGLGTMQALSAGFARAAPAHTIVIVPNLGTGGGLKALAAGAIDVAVIARPLKPDEHAQGLTAVEYGKTPFVLATSKAGAGKLGSRAELADMLSGRTTAWPGGAPVRPVMRPRQDSDTAILETFSPAVKQAVSLALARPGMIIASTDQDAADTIEKTPGAIGSTTLALVRTEKRQLDIQTINGVVPSPATLANGSYPYGKTMYLARNGAGSAAINSFLDFVASPPGRQIVADSGHWVAGTVPGK